MAPNELASIIQQLETNIRKGDNKTSSSLLSRAKIALLHQHALIPSSSTPPKVLEQAQYVLELGALISIRHKDPQAFTRYFQQLQPFYNSAPPTSKSQRSKVTGLYLLLLLSLGDYAGFHTQLEGLEVINDASGKGIDQDQYIQYAVRLEQWLMEGSYDRVWSETKSERVPSDEFAIFSDILINTIRNEVASCSERAYASIPVTNAKSLFFLDSEGGVIDFSRQRGWQTTDGRIYFPPPDSTSGENDLLAATGQVIENTLGYARELETIV